jgi:hypothetical protein
MTGRHRRRTVGTAETGVGLSLALIALVVILLAAEAPGS